MSADEVPQSDLSNWPAIDQAYDFVIPSYQMLAARYESADTRLTALMTMTSTLTLGTPLFARAVRPDVDFGNPLFIAGVCLFIAMFIAGIVGRLLGRLILPDPSVMYAYLHERPCEFKKNAVFLAGKHFVANADAIRTKGNFGAAISCGFMFEVTVFVLWLSK
jgi:hypothetical protein